MAEYLLTSPEGEEFKVNAPDDATEEQVMTYFRTELPKQAKSPRAPRKVAANPAEYDPTSIDYQIRYGSQPFNAPHAVGEALLNVGSSLVASPASGLAGIGTSVGHQLGLTDTQGAQAVEAVGNAMTYQPRTPEGQRGAEVLTYPFRKLAEFGDWAGGGVSDAIDRPFWGPAVGAAVNTAVQSVPALLFGGLMRPRGQAKASKPAQPKLTPEEIAAEHVTRNTSLDWDSLSPQIQQRLASITGDAKNLAGLDWRAIERQVQLESLPVKVPATSGQLTRDPVQLRNEGNVAATTGGKPIRDIHVAQNRAILDNLETLKGRQRGKAETPEQVGLSVQDAALRRNLEAKKSQVRALYKQAEEAGELQGTAPTRSLARLIDETPDKMHLGWVESWLGKADVITTETGAATKGMRYKASLKELEDLRQAAVARAMNGGTEGYYAGKVIKAIDEATEGVGGSAYAAARKARKEQALQFEEQGAVARLVENKSRTDRSVALEDTWRKTVLGGSIEDLRAVKAQLLTGATRVAGRQAWRDIRAETIQHIINEATKSVAKFEDGTPNVTPAAMDRAIRSIGKDKIDEIFGAGSVNALNNIMNATKIVKTEPPPSFKGSPTFANAIAFLEKSIGKIPLAGDMVTGAVKGAAALRQMGETGRQVRAAQQTPLDKAGAQVTKNTLRGRSKNALLRGLPYTSATEGQ